MAEASTPSPSDQVKVGENLLDRTTRDALADGLVVVFKPAVEEIDEKVHTVRMSQVELRQQIDSLADDLRRISDSQQVPIDLDPYVKKLNNARRRVVLVSNILQNSQDRLQKLQHSIAKETSKRKTAVSQISQLTK